MTYDSLMTFNLRRAHGVKIDSLKIPTLREALLCCKDRILVNVDHAYPYYKEIVELAEELGVTGQVLMKGTSSVGKVAEYMSRYENNLLYMPIICSVIPAAAFRWRLFAVVLSHITDFLFSR